MASFSQKKTSIFSLERGNNPPHTHIQYGGKISSSHPITRGLCRYPFSVILIYAPVDGHRTMYITGPTALRCLSRVTINRTSSRCWNKAKLSKCSHCCTHLCLSPPPPVWHDPSEFRMLEFMRWWKNFDDKLSRFDSIPDRDRWTDGHLLTANTTLAYQRGCENIIRVFLSTNA